MLFQKMYYVEDEHFARRLQTELQAYENFKLQKENTEKENLNPIDSKLEYIDPTPSIHDLFVKFNKKFFWNTLGMVQVLWSNKMTKCAGMCSFEGGRGLCKISLSAPLLSLRPRKDLVETLLHEMIHAYLFVTHNYKDREDHGPEFHKHMYRINKEAGTKITVYHTFYDEVEYYQRHIWRCNGPCQKKKPYFGFVRRAINRPPGPYDTWWSQHQKECGGTFIKISEPERTNQKVKKTKVVKTDGKTKDIRDFFTNKNPSATSIKSQKDSKSSNIKTLSDLKNNKPVLGVKTNAGTGTVVITSNNKGKNSKVKNPKSPKITKEKGKHTNKAPNVMTLHNVRGPSTGFSSGNQSKGLDSVNVKETVRNVWANKFTNCKSSDKELQEKPSPKKNSKSSDKELQEKPSPKKNSKSSDKELQEKPSPKKNSKSSDKELQEKPSPKKIKLECPICVEGFSEEDIQSHVEECLGNPRNSETDKKNLQEEESEGSSREKTDEMKRCPVCSESFLESEMNDHLENCLSCTFENESDSDFDDEIVCESVPCPCCYKWFKESEMNAHIDECLTVRTLKEELIS